MPAPWQISVKYALDRAIAVPLFVLLLPVFALIALAIRLDDRGPALFRQRRVGEGGATFDILKFRTMIVDADRHLDAAGMPTRPRVTRVGKWLRRTSLDELPQLINILRGEMSCIGPRPLLPDNEKALDAKFADRHLMRPGVTGLAQVNGRNNLPWSRRIAYDLEYVRSYSLLLDLKILIKTFGVVLAMRNVSDDRNKTAVDDL